jgi:hypothetical protein
VNGLFGTSARLGNSVPHSRGMNDALLSPDFIFISQFNGIVSFGTTEHDASDRADHVQQIIGAVVDVTFTDSVPPVLTALTVDAKETGQLLIF